MANDGAIAGATIGGIGFLCFAVALYYMFVWRHRHLAKRHGDDSSPLESVVVEGGNKGVAQTAQRSKSERLIEIVTSGAFPKEKGFATISSSGTHYVDHHFVTSLSEQS